MGLSGKIEKGLVFIVSAPAGAGKTTLVNMLIKEFPKDLSRSISCTTRAPRNNEKDGVDYHFIEEQTFDQYLEEDAFIEHAKVFSNRYGTLKKTIQETTNSGKHVFLVIDTQGAFTLMKKIKALFIFIMPPSIEELSKRLESRNTDSKESIKERLSWAKKEMDQAKHFDCIIVNDQLEQAYEDLKEFVIQAEKKLCQYI